MLAWCSNKAYSSLEDIFKEIKLFWISCCWYSCLIRYVLIIFYRFTEGTSSASLLTHSPMGHQGFRYPAVWHWKETFANGPQCVKQLGSVADRHNDNWTVDGEKCIASTDRDSSRHSILHLLMKTTWNHHILYLLYHSFTVFAEWF